MFIQLDKLINTLSEFFSLFIKISFISKCEQNAKNSQVFCFSGTFLKSIIVSYKPKHG